ncbi:MAG: Na+/H+ antiporter subunit E [Firmicutes bacterium]|nr:Na+/H+ antiporter subunit E [Bacillota bacterium]
MTKQIALHLLLGLVWVLLTDDVNLKNLVIGLFVGGVILWYYQRARGSQAYFSRLLAGVKLCLVLLWEQLLSSLQVARLVLSPRGTIRPGIVAVPLTVTRDGEITTVANMVTLTPGSISIDVSDDGRVLYVHTIDVQDPQAIVDSVRRFEALVKGVTGS